MMLSALLFPTNLQVFTNRVRREERASRMEEERRRKKETKGGEENITELVESIKHLDLQHLSLRRDPFKEIILNSIFSFSE